MGGEYVIVKQNQYMRIFRKAGATDRAHAKPAGDLGVRENSIFRGLVNQGVLVDAGGGAYYLDMSAAEDFVARRRKKAFFMFVIILFVLLILFLFNGKMFK
jgi:hypothetical protein